MRVRSRLHRGPEIRRTGCRAGPGHHTQCRQPGRGGVQAAWRSRSVFCVLGWWSCAGCMGEQVCVLCVRLVGVVGCWLHGGRSVFCVLGWWVGGVVQAAWGEQVCVLCVGLVVCVEGCWLHGGAGRCSVCWVGLVWRGVGCMREQVGALCVGLVRVG